MSLSELTKHFDATLKVFEDEVKKLRTGRANASMLDGIKVEVYGQLTPLNHIATIGVVDASLLQVSPYDPNNLSAISTAIREDATLGLNPADDGRVIRLPIPSMTTERRQEVVKVLHEKAELARVAFRNARHDLLNELKQQLASKAISEDEHMRQENELSTLLETYQGKLESILNAKEQEILTV